MAESTADVRRDIEMTRERISETLSQLEQKTNVIQIVKDHPWPALAVAVGAGVLLSGSSADLKAAAATATATRGASSKVGTVLDDVVANLMGGLSLAFQSKIEGLVNELKEAIGAPPTPATGGNGAAKGNSFADRAPTSGGMTASGTSNIGSASAAAHGDDTSAGMHAGWGGGTGAAGASVSAAGSQGSPAATHGSSGGHSTRAD